jgi:hypothetical protein
VSGGIGTCEQDIFNFIPHISHVLHTKIMSSICQRYKMHDYMAFNL